MLKDDVEVGGTYMAKVGTKSVEVRIERESKGGFDAKSVATGKPIRIKDVKHLRPAATAHTDDPIPAKEPKAPGSKVAKAPREKASAMPKAMSCLDAAAAVLKAGGTAMNCKAMVAAMAEQKLWTSDAPTPHATLFSALLREIAKKGAASRFRKAERGHFTLNDSKGD
jgi:hypothetical protein